MTRALLNLLLLMSLAAIGGAGCNVVGVAGKVFDNDKSNAVYAIPKRPTVVIAEKYANPSESAMDDEPLARFVTENLRERDVAPLADADRVYTLRRGMSPAKWHAMTIDAVGRAVGAEQVLYINLINVNVLVEPGAGMMKGQAEARVRLVDTQSGQTIWPADAADGWPVGVDMPMQRMTDDNVTQSAVRTNVLRDLADRIAKLFYTYERS